MKRSRDRTRRHSRESGNPGPVAMCLTQRAFGFLWIPASAGMTLAENHRQSGSGSRRGASERNLPERRAAVPDAEAAADWKSNAAGIQRDVIPEKAGIQGRSMCPTQRAFRALRIPASAGMTLAEDHRQSIANQERLEAGSFSGSSASGGFLDELPVVHQNAASSSSISGWLPARACCISEAVSG